MAQLGATFDASQVDPSQPFETLPPGDYRVQIVASEMRPTKAGTGQYLWMEMEILDGPFSGKRVFDRLNLINPNQQAADIAQRTLSAICHAVGRMQVSDSEELHFKPLLVKVVVDKEGYNQTKGYKPVANAIPAARPAFQPQQARYQQSPQQQPAQYQQPVQQQPVQQQPAQYQQPVQQQPVQQPAQYQQPVQQQPVQQQPVQQPAQYQQPVQQQPTQYQQPVQSTQPAPAPGGVGPWKRTV